MSKLKSMNAIEALLDEIKDEIDRLHEISPKHRLDAARDLIEYILLHHVEHSS